MASNALVGESMALRILTGKRYYIALNGLLGSGAVAGLPVTTRRQSS
jgi:hypothetical protein